MCKRKGLAVPAKEVDHIIPHEGIGALLWPEENWQALCVPCHRAKTYRQRFEGLNAAELQMRTRLLMQHSCKYPEVATQG